MIKRLQMDTHLLKRSDEIIAQQERREFIEKVDIGSPTTGQVYYIPHLTLGAQV